MSNFTDDPTYLSNYLDQSYKDRSAVVSTLSEPESHRFHRAIYRVWICSALANDNHQDSKPIGLDSSFLTNMSEEELVQMHEAMKFLDVVYSIMMGSFQQGKYFSNLESPPVLSSHSGPFMRQERPFELRVDQLLAALDGKVNTSAVFGLALSRSATAIVNTYRGLVRDKQVSDLFKTKYDHRTILTDANVEDIQTCKSSAYYLFCCDNTLPVGGKCLAQARDLFGENSEFKFYPSFSCADLLLQTGICYNE